MSQSNFNRIWEHINGHIQKSNNHIMMATEHMDTATNLIKAFLVEGVDENENERQKEKQKEKPKI